MNCSNDFCRMSSWKQSLMDRRPNTLCYRCCAVKDSFNNDGPWYQYCPQFYMSDRSTPLTTLILSHYRLKNDIYITHTIKISSDLTKSFGRHDPCFGWYNSSCEMTGDLTGNLCITILSHNFSWKLSDEWLLFAGGSIKTDLFCRWFVPYIRDMIGFSLLHVVIKPSKVVELQISANKTPLIQILRRP